MKRLIVIGAAAACGLFANHSFAAGGQTWSAGPDLAANELSSTKLSNPNGVVPQWSYGYRDNVASTGITLFSGTADHTDLATSGSIFQGWQKKRTNWSSVPLVAANISGTNVDQCNLDEIVVHPTNQSMDGTYAVVRWTAPVSGTFVINSGWRDADSRSGDGVDAHLVLNGVSIFDGALVNGGTTSATRTLALTAGDNMDIVTGPGPSGYDFCDSTALNVVIEALNTPAPPVQQYVEYVAESGSAVGPKVPGAVFRRLFSPATNSDGHIVMAASMLPGRAGVTERNDLAIFLDKGDGFEIVARQGTHAPGFQNMGFFGFDCPVINSKGDVAFIASVLGRTSSGEGLWTSVSGTLSLIAGSSQPAPGVQSGQFDHFKRVILPDKGGPVFVASVRGSARDGIWATDADGNVSLVAVAGLPYPVGDPQGKLVRSIQALDRVAQTRSVSPLGDVAFQLTYMDGSSNILRLVRH